MLSRTGPATGSRPDPVLTDDSDVSADAGGAARFDTNLEAIRTAQRLDTEQRPATPAEQAVLVKFSGFGDTRFNEAFKEEYQRPEPAWAARRKALQEIVTPEQFESIERSRLNAFYTTPVVIKGMWEGLRQMGAADIPNPRVLEPSAGAGRFLGYQPPDMAARSTRVAVELDTLTALVLAKAYPNTAVYRTGFQDAPIADDSVDIAISNVPFGDYPVLDPAFGKARRFQTRQIHNYFFAKALDKVRPGGAVAFVTSHSSLDSSTHRDVREALAERADLVAAFRLPNDAFPDTRVTTDVIFMRKRAAGDPPGDASWVDTVETPFTGEYGSPVHVPLNAYFVNHPENVLGKPALARGLYRRDEYSVESEPGKPFAERMRRAMGTLPAGVIKDAPVLAAAARSVPTLTPKNARNGSYVIVDGKLAVKTAGAVRDAGLDKDDGQRVTEMLRVRDAARKVLGVQLSGVGDLAAEQSALNTAYDSFVARHGALGSQRNTALMAPDADGPFLRALEQPAAAEKVRKAAKVTAAQAGALKMPIFSQRVVRGLGAQTATDAKDALAVVLNEKGRVDFNRMGELLGRDPGSVRKELADSQLVFKDPLGDWQQATAYLSGDVRRKLEVAEVAAAASPEFRANVAALKAAQPADLPPADITARLGAPWIPASDVDGFISHTLRVNPPGRNRGGDPTHYFEYMPITGEWRRANRIFAGSGLNEGQWGTPRMPATAIIERLLNGRQVEVSDKDPDGKSVRNAVETVAAQAKAAALEDEFGKWVWSDSERATRLAADYNRKFNNIVPRRYDGSHQTLPGMAPEWYAKLHPHQRDSIWRVVQDGTVMLAHEVGFGKTAVMVSSGMELRRLGLSRKNLYVVPKATHAQFVSQIKSVYPYAQVLAPAEKDFTTANRAEFVSRIATGDWDAVVLTQEQFQRIPLSPKTEAEFLTAEIRTYRDALQETDDKITHKNLQKALERMNVRLQEKLARSRDITDKTIYFEDLGTDQLYADEADAYKNLAFVTQMGRLKGLPNSESQRSWDMYQKVRWMQQKGNGRGVVFATGTPVANTIAELYTQMRYLQPAALEGRQLEHFDAWAKTFGATTEGLEQTPAGTYRVTQRFAKFVNVPELSNMWQDTADIRVAREVPALVRVRPRLVDDKGQPRRTVVPAPPSTELLLYMKELEKRADEMKGKRPEEDNMLKLSGDARKASLDLRLVVPDAPDNPAGKTALAAQNIARIYRETEADKGTQLVFLDLGTPKVADKAPTPDEGGTDAASQEADTASETQQLDSVYADLRRKIVAAGVPDSDIAFAHDAKTDAQRERLYDRVRSGAVRVFIGSTAKMGAGVNVQDRAAALHHLDAPWRPRDIEQREGRIVRQGNVVYGPKFNEKGELTDPGKGVRIYTYVTERSFDAFMWQAIEAKAVPIRVIMRRETGPRVIDDADSLVLSASEAKAIASGNPDVGRRVGIQNQLTKLAMLRGSHQNARVRASTQIAALPKQIAVLRESIGRTESDIPAAKAAAAAPFGITLQGRDYGEKERAEAGLAMEKAVTTAAMVTEAPARTEIGSFKGFRILTGRDFFGYHVTAVGKSGEEYTTASIPIGSLSGAGAVTRIENLVKGLEGVLAERRKRLAEHERNLTLYEEQAKAPFEREADYRRLELELAAVEKKLAGADDVGAPENLAVDPGEEVGEAVAEDIGPSLGPAQAEFDLRDQAVVSEGVAQAEAALAAAKAVERETILKQVAERQRAEAEGAAEAAKEAERAAAATPPTTPPAEARQAVQVAAAATEQAQTERAEAREASESSSAASAAASQAITAAAAPVGRRVQFREEQEASRREYENAQAAVGTEWDSPQGRRRVESAEIINGEVKLKVRTGDSPQLELLSLSQLAGDVQRESAAAVSRAAAKAAEIRSAAEAPYSGLDRATLGQFRATVSPMERARAFETLRTVVSVGGRAVSRQALIDSDLAAGATVTVAHNERRLQTPDGSYRSEGQLTTTGIDYAIHRLATESRFAREMAEREKEQVAEVRARARPTAVVEATPKLVISFGGTEVARVPGPAAAVVEAPAKPVVSPGGAEAARVRGLVAGRPEHRGTLIQFPAGSWGFVGSVPGELAYERKDGSTPTEKELNDAKAVGPRLIGLRGRSWPTREAAEAARSELAERTFDKGVRQLTEYQEAVGIKPAAPRKMPDVTAQFPVPAVVAAPAARRPAERRPQERRVTVSAVTNAAPLAAAGEVTAQPDEPRIVASVITPEGTTARRVRVKPQARVSLRVGATQTVTATLKTAAGETVERQRARAPGSRIVLGGPAASRPATGHLSDVDVASGLSRQSNRGRAIDRRLSNAREASRKAHTVADVATHRAWQKDPGRADIRTIDTKRAAVQTAPRPKLGRRKVRLD